VTHRRPERTMTARSCTRHAITPIRSSTAASS
jgi:hypothetical protein